MKQKNLFMVGVLALALTFGFTLSACGDGGGGGGGNTAKLKVVNEYSNPITRVEVTTDHSYAGKTFDFPGQNIIDSKDFTIELGQNASGYVLEQDWAYVTLYVVGLSDDKIKRGLRFYKNKTSTITLSDSGTISVKDYDADGTPNF